MGFQTRVNNQPGVAAVGDFADANIRANVLAGPGALVAAELPRSPIVGRFAWGDQVANAAGAFQAYSRFDGQTTAKIGFVHRENNAVIVPFLADNQQYLESGLIITLFDQGSFWAHFAGAAAVGQKVFANYLDGSVYAATAGTSTQTADITASLASTGILTVTVLNAGGVTVGAVITGSGVPAGVAILSQLSGTAGGAGTYQTTKTGSTVGSGTMLANASVETNFSVDSPAKVNCAFTASLSVLGVLTVSAISSGVLEVGQLIAGSGVQPNMRILGQITGSAGSTGTYRTTAVMGPALTSRSMTASQGMLAKISTWG